MGYHNMDGGLYDIPSHGIYIDNQTSDPATKRSKYFDVVKDTQVGLHLGDIGDLREQYIKQVCGGIPWNNPLQRKENI